AADSSLLEGGTPSVASRRNSPRSSATLNATNANARRTQRRVGLVTYGVPEARAGTPYKPTIHNQVPRTTSSSVVPANRGQTPHGAPLSQPTATSSRPMPHAAANRGRRVSNPEEVRSSKKR